jgi:hypothetical protein
MESRRTDSTWRARHFGLARRIIPARRGVIVHRRGRGTPFFPGRTKENTEPVAPSSTTPTSFPPGLAASAYDPQERLQPRSAPCSVPRQPTTSRVQLQRPACRDSRNEREDRGHRSPHAPWDPDQEARGLRVNLQLSAETLRAGRVACDLSIAVSWTRAERSSSMDLECCEPSGRWNASAGWLRGLDDSCRGAQDERGSGELAKLPILIRGRDCADQALEAAPQHSVRDAEFPEKLLETRQVSPKGQAPSPYARTTTGSSVVGTTAPRPARSAFRASTVSRTSSPLCATSAGNEIVSEAT